LALLVSSTSTQAQQPPVRILLGFPPGGPIDNAARLIAPSLAEALNRQIVIDNRAGANGIVATELAAHATPDGRTLFFGTAGNLAVNPVLYPKLPFDVTRDFAALSHVASTSSLIYVHPSLPVKTLPEFIAHAAASPGKLGYSSSGIGGLPHLSGELLNLAAKIKTLHVPYKGTAPAFAALLGGEVQFAISAVVSGLQHVRSGKLHAIATTTKKRIALLPGTPTASETLPGLEIDNWYGMVAPAGTPPNTLNQLQRAIAQALSTTTIQEKLSSQGMEPVGGTPQAFDVFLKAEIIKWGRVVKSANIRPE
jgi:tripartite-type tricarboxylate transporter receptor subunit TctC